MKKLLCLLSILLLGLPGGALAQGPTWAQATPLSEGHTAVCAMSPTTFSHWFYIEVPGDGIVEMDIEPGGELSIGQLDIRNSVPNGEDLPVRQHIWPGMQAGTLRLLDAGAGRYYVNVWKSGSDQGTYQLKWRFIPNTYAGDTEPNDEPGTGDFIPNGSTVEGHLGYATPDNRRDEEDNFCLEVPGTGVIDLEVEPEETLDFLKINLLYRDPQTQEMKVHEKIEPGNRPGSMRVIDTNANTYYVQLLRRGGRGGYRLTYRYTPNAYAEDTEPNDEPGTGDWLAQGEAVEGQLGYRYPNDQRDKSDCFRLEVPGNGTLEVELTPAATLSVNPFSLLYLNPEFQRFESRTLLFLGSVQGTLCVKDAGPGTYYVRLSHYHGQGGYRLSTRFTPALYPSDTEPNDEQGTGDWIASGQQVTGNVGYRDATNLLDLDDWFRLKTDGLRSFVLTYEREETSELSVGSVGVHRLRNGQNRVVGTVYPGQSVQASLAVGDVQEGDEYYVLVRRTLAQGSYSLALEGEHAVGVEAIRSSEATPWTLFLPNGMVVARGKGQPNVRLQPGVYLIRQGGKTKVLSSPPFPDSPQGGENE